MAGAGAPAEAQDNGARPRIQDIDFAGNESIMGDSLELAIANRESGCRNLIFKLIPLCPLGVGFTIEDHYLQPQELRRDPVRLQVYYYQRGYREAQVAVDTTRTDGQMRITFRIDEGRPVRVDSLYFTGDALPDSSVIQDIPLEVGDPLSGILLEAATDTILGRLRNQGYAHADILRSIDIPRDPEAEGGRSTGYSARVGFDIYTGPRARFGPITVAWASDQRALARNSVLRFLPFREGDLYRRDEILQAQRSLFGVDLIQSAEIRADTAHQPDSVIPVTVTIQEGDVHRVRTGTGWSTANCLNAEARWTSRNFMGAARRLSVLGRVSNVLADQLRDVACFQSGEGEFADLNWHTSVEFNQPWIFSTRNSFAASLYAERASLPDVFIRRAIGLNLGLTRVFGRNTPVTLFYRPQLSTLDAAEIFFCTSFLVCTPEDIDVLEGANWLSPVGVSASRNRTDDILNPTEGYQLRLDLEHSSGITGSNYGYNRAVGEANLYHSLARRTVLAGRIRGGWIGAAEFEGLGLVDPARIVHPLKRFYAGGANSVRGFPQNRLGPRVLTTDVANLLGFVETEGGGEVQICAPEEIVDLTCDPQPAGEGAFLPRPTGGTRVVEANLEYRFRFGGNLQGVAFLDAGQVWREREAIDLGEMELSPGVGVRYFSPIGPVRLDIGYRFRRGQELQVVTAQIRPAPDDAQTDDLICAPRPGEDCERLPWVRTDGLALLEDRFLYGASAGFFRNLQIHLSLGQAF